MALKKETANQCITRPRLAPSLVEEFLQFFLEPQSLKSSTALKSATYAQTLTQLVSTGKEGCYLKNSLAARRFRKVLIS
jgi:hypothetical protein